MAVWRLPVFRVVGRRRVDVHGQHLEPVRHFTGPVSGRYTARPIPKSDDQLPCQSAGGHRVGA